MFEHSEKDSQINFDGANISVIVPVYKCEKYIGSCIESILAQSMSNFQLILVDDGSPDGAPGICDEYAHRDNRILVIHKQNGGVSSARNAGLDVAMGKYITFIDSDDYIDPDFLKDLWVAALENGADLVASGLVMENWSGSQCESSVAYSFSEDKEYDGRLVLEAWDHEYPAICLCGPCCKLYRRSMIEQAQIRFSIQLDCGEDTYFNMEFLEQNPKVYTLSKNYYHYRRESGESLFSRFHRDTYEIHACVYGKMREVMEKLACSSEAMEIFEEQYFRLLLGGIHEYYRFYHESTLKEKKELMKKVATDPYMVRLKANKITGKKNRILFFLLRAKLYTIVHWIFQLNYKRR